MHDIVLNELEKHFSGDAARPFYDHLDACPDCRAEVSAMSDVASIFRDFKVDTEAAIEPTLGFYNRVVATIDDKQKKQAWGLFSPGAAFFRRIAFASLLVLASLGSFLVTRESSRDGTDAAAIMAEPEYSNVQTGVADRDRLLVTLAAYR